MQQVCFLFFLFFCYSKLPGYFSRLNNFENSDSSSFIDITLQATKNLPSSQISALYDLWYQTNGSNWVYTNVSSQSQRWNWSEADPNPCSSHWQGLTCNCNFPTYCLLTEIDLDSHNLRGSLPSTINQLSSLTTLSLFHNGLTGNFPSSLSELPVLGYLNLGSNLLVGTIPGSISSITTLLSFSVFDNFFTAIDDEAFNLPFVQIFQIGINHIQGSIPSTITKLQRCKSFSIISNFFNSTIPSEFSQLQDLINIDISYNRLTGTIPNSIVQITNLTSFAANVNELHGTIPQDLGNLTNLLDLFLYDNQLVGSLPASIGSLHHIITFDLVNNLLDSSLPDSIINCSMLQSLLISENGFTGEIPAALFELDDFRVFLVYKNFFEGNLYKSLSDTEKVIYFDVGTNLFSGSIPFRPSWQPSLYLLEGNVNYFTGSITTEFANCSVLNYFNFGANYLTGSVPDSFGTNYKLEYLNISANQITGSIPASLSQLAVLGQLSVAQNYMTGTIPLQLGSLFRLVIFSINDNQFTGTIPHTIQNWKKLQFFFIQQNVFTGPISQVLNYTAQPGILNIDVSNNQFTGTIPPEFFMAVNLSSFAASSNCLSGEIPSAICQAKSLTGLSLDGLTTSENCRIPIFDSIPAFNSFVVKKFMHGSIPWCLFSLPLLQSLHLSGNGYTGSLPTDLNITVSLQDLSLSHNNLHGTIPSVLQSKTWINFDLSYNKFSGTLQHNFYEVPAGGSVYLQLNRLSGSLPKAINNAPVVQVLDGNIFSCNTLETDLPHNDPEAEDYSCGSDAVNRILYFWCGMFVGIILFSMGLYCYSKRINLWVAITQQHFQRYYLKLRRWQLALQEIPVNDSNQHTTKSMNNLSIFFREIRFSFSVLAIFAIIVLIPLYYSISVFSHSYTNEYAWSISAVLLTGQIPASFLICAFTAMIVLVFYLFNRLAEKTKVVAIYDLVHHRQRMTIAEGIVHRVTRKSRASRVSRVSRTSEGQAPEDSWFSNSFSFYGGRAVSTMGGGRVTRSTVSDLTHSTISHSNPSEIATGTGNKEGGEEESHHNPQPTGDATEPEERIICWNWTAQDFRRYFVYFLVAFVNLCLMIVIDFCYVYIVLNNEATIVTISEIGLAMVKILLNNALLWQSLPMSYYFVTWLFSGGDYLAQHGYRSVVEMQRKFRYSIDDITFLERIILYNNVIIPALAIFVVSSDCFYYALYAADQVVSSYSYVTCHRYIGTTSECERNGYITQTSSVTYSPPFIYSFQCSSKIAINYIPVFIVMFIFVGMIIPMVKVLLKLYYDKIYALAEEEKKAEARERERVLTVSLIAEQLASPTTGEMELPVMGGVDRVTTTSDPHSDEGSFSLGNSSGGRGRTSSNHRLHSSSGGGSDSLDDEEKGGDRITSDDHQKKASAISTASSEVDHRSSQKDEKKKSKDRGSDLSSIASSLQSSLSLLSQRLEGLRNYQRQLRLLELMIPENLKRLRPRPRHNQPPLFAKLRVTAQINSYLAILLAFGGLFPPLAVIAALAVISITYYEECNFGRLLLEARALGYTWAEQRLEVDCREISESTSLTLPPIIFVSSLLFAYILFDTWGDEKGATNALLPCLLMCGVPIIVMLCQIFAIWYRTERLKRRTTVFDIHRAATIGGKPEDVELAVGSMKGGEGEGSGERTQSAEMIENPLRMTHTHRNTMDIISNWHREMSMTSQYDRSSIMTTVSQANHTTTSPPTRRTIAWATENHHHNESKEKKEEEIESNNTIELTKTVNETPETEGEKEAENEKVRRPRFSDLPDV